VHLLPRVLLHRRRAHRARDVPRDEELLVAREVRPRVLLVAALPRPRRALRANSMRANVGVELKGVSWS
jgi:hypothetical protein